MSYYYRYNFISPEGVYSTVKEELKSYFDTGAIDDLMFPTYLNKCLEKLGRSSYVIDEIPLFVEDFEARLPDNFYAVREAWMCGEVPLTAYQDANSFYAQAASSTTIQILPVTIAGEACTSVCSDPECPTCMPILAQAVYKSNNTTVRSFRQQYLLKPGNISAKQRCDVTYTEAWNFHKQPESTYTSSNPFSNAADSFDIRDNKFITNFRCGVVHLIFYATSYDNSSNQMMPDNYRIKEYIEAFIKYKMFELLSNQVIDETYNQIQQKLVYYKQLCDEAFIMASIEIKKQTPWEKQRRIIQDLNRFRMYQLAGSSQKTWRRNGNGGNMS